MRELLRKYWRLISLGLALIASLTYYSSQLRYQAETSPLERNLLTIIYPLQKGFILANDGLASLRAMIFGSSRAAIEEVRQENARFKEKLTEQEEFKQENERLKKLLSFRLERDEEMIGARVIGYDASSWFRTMTIDRGTADHLREGMAVVSTYGVVGRIVTTSSRSSRVLLAVDSSSRLSTLIERTRARAICRGNGEGMNLDYLPLTDDVQVDDLLITSGLGGGFPKGLIVGRVSSVDKRGYDMFQTVKVEAAVNFDRLEEVLVIVSDDPAAPGKTAGHP